MPGTRISDRKPFGANRARLDCIPGPLRFNCTTAGERLRHPIRCYDFPMRSVSLLLFSCLMLPRGQRSSDAPLQHLPPNIEVLTHFGERADISPDNQRVVFMTKSFGDAMVIDLKTRVIQCLPCNVPAAVFLRVM